MIEAFIELLFLQLYFIFNFINEHKQLEQFLFYLHFSSLSCLVCLLSWHGALSRRQLTLNSLSPPRPPPSCHSVSLYSEFCRGGGWEVGESDKTLSGTDPCPIPGKWRRIWYIVKLRSWSGQVRVRMLGRSEKGPAQKTQNLKIWTWAIPYSGFWFSICTLPDKLFSWLLGGLDMSVRWTYLPRLHCCILFWRW